MPYCIAKYKDETKALVYRNAQRKANYKKGRPVEGSKRRWNDSEIALLTEYKQDDRELALVIRRSVQAIQVKRCKLELEKLHEEKES